MKAKVATHLHPGSSSGLLVAIRGLVTEEACLLQPLSGIKLEANPVPLE